MHWLQLLIWVKIVIHLKQTTHCVKATKTVASIQGQLKYGLVPIAGVIVRMRFNLPRIWVIVLRT